MANDVVTAGSAGKVAAMSLGGAVVVGLIAVSFYLSALWLGLAAVAIALAMLVAFGVKRAV